jgi:cytoplasmic polyadenylation element-binding protein
LNLEVFPVGNLITFLFISKGELAAIMNKLYGGVCYAGIDIDPELKYPKGAGRVSFNNQQSFVAAINSRFIQLQYNEISKRVRVRFFPLL